MCSARNKKEAARRLKEKKAIQDKIDAARRKERNIREAAEAKKKAAKKAKEAGDKILKNVRNTHATNETKRIIDSIRCGTHAISDTCDLDFSSSFFCDIDLSIAACVPVSSSICAPVCSLSIFLFDCCLISFSCSLPVFFRPRS